MRGQQTGTGLAGEALALHGEPELGHLASGRPGEEAWERAPWVAPEGTGLRQEAAERAWRPRCSEAS